MPHPVSCTGAAGTSAFSLNKIPSRPGFTRATLSAALRRLFDVAVDTGTGKKLSRQAQVQLCYCLSSLLHEPEPKVRQWLKLNTRYLARIERFRNRAQSQARLRAHKDSFKFQQRQEFEALLRADGRSRILLGFHFGDFIYGNNVLADSEPAGRSQYFLTQLPPTDDFLHNMHCCFGDERFSNRAQLIVEDTTAAELAALLRRSHCSLLSFADLPAGFGERVAVNFLGRRAWFPKGPATLALVCKVPLLPVMNWWDGKHNHLQLFDQIEPGVHARESLQEATTRITQTLAGILEQLLLQYPWQWRFLSALPAFFVEPDDGSGKD